MSQNGGTYTPPTRTFVSTSTYFTPVQYIKTDEEDQDWVLVTVDDEKITAATGSSGEYQTDFKLGWGEKKVTVFRYCWKYEETSQRCGKCDGCRKSAEKQSPSLKLES